MLKPRRIRTVLPWLAFGAAFSAAPEANGQAKHPHQQIAIAPPVSEEQLELLREDAAAAAPLEAQSIQLVVATPAGPVRAEELLPLAPPVPQKELTPRSGGIDHPGRVDGFLSGKVIYLSQCHGWHYSEALGRFATQRGNTHGTVEDFHNPEGMNQFLTHYLENAGALVFTARERDQNPSLAIADNDGSGYSETGSGFESAAAGFADGAPWPHGVNPFDQGSTRRFPAQGGGIATWKPAVPEAGHYAVYLSWDSDADNSSRAHYRITHPGGVIDRYFDQRVHGSTWVFAEKLWLEAGESLTVELIGDASDGQWLSADAVRIGGGMSRISRNGVTSQKPAWEDATISHAQRLGAPTSVYDPYSDGDGSDPSARSRWAAWEHPTGEDAIYLSWHSNAATGTARGTVTYYAGSECSNPAINGSLELSTLVQNELAGRFTEVWESDWFDRGVRTSCFAEVNPNYNPEMPSTLVELAFHDNAEDAAFLKHPRFRHDSARAMYRGIARYFAERDGITPTFAPEPPAGVTLLHDAEGNLQLSWAPGPSGGNLGDAATSYRVFLSFDGKAWDNGRDASTTSLTLDDVPRGETVFVRVAGVNDGGVSFPSQVVGARRALGTHAPVLVVAAFDRLDSGLLLTEDGGGGLGEIVHMDLMRMNPEDGVVAHGNAISNAGYPFDATLDEALPDLDLSRYRVIVWQAGQESTDDESFDDAQQALLRQFVEAGGKLWTSGSEVLWDLDQLGTATDQAFASEVLGAGLESDDAGTTSASGENLLAGAGPLDFDLLDGAPYPVPYPDVLTAQGETIARYETGGVAAALTGSTAHFGFPFETIGSADTRAEVASRLLDTFVSDWEDVPVEGTGGTGSGGSPATGGAGGTMVGSGGAATGVGGAGATSGSTGVSPASRRSGGDDGGCFCSAAGSTNDTSPPAVLVLGLLGLAALRRPRRGER